MQYVPSGVYFARVRHKGKLFRVGLETNVITIAKLTLLDNVRQLMKPGAAVGTFRAILEHGGLGHLEERGQEQIAQAVLSGWVQVESQDVTADVFIVWVSRDFHECAAAFCFREGAEGQQEFQVIFDRLGIGCGAH